MKPLLKRLVIDTATPYLYIALYEDSKCLNRVYQKGNNDHSVTLMDNIETMFKQLKWEVSQLDEIIVGVGPGSYTGVRIGVVVAKMFAWSHDIPLKSVSTTALLASSGSEGKIFAYVDARRQKAFGGFYQKTDNTLKRLSDDVYDDLKTLKNSASFDQIINHGEPSLSVLLDSGLLNTVDNIHDLSPTYLRKTEAERNLEQKK